MMAREGRNRNTGLKVLSAVFALLLWIYVVSEGQNPTRHNVREVNLNYYNLGEGLTAQGPDTVRVKIWGAEDEIEEIEVYIDLNNLKEGTYKLPVKVRTLKGALLTTVEPKEVEVKIKRINEHIFKINYRTVGALPPGYELFGLQISPDTCLLKGEEKALSRVAGVECEVNLSEIRGSSVVELPIKAVDKEGKEVHEGISLLPQKATVYIAAGNMLKNKETAVSPVVLEQSLETGYEIGGVTVIPDKVTLLGDPGLMEGLEKINTLPVSLEGRSSSFSQKVKLVLPDKIKGYPDEVLVNIEIKKKENE